MRTDLLRRIEKLEAANPASATRLRVALKFIGPRLVDEIPGRASCKELSIIRSPNETAEAFEDRAFDHFAELDAAPWPLIVLFK